MLLLVHSSSERTLEPVRSDCSFAEKQQPQPARLLDVSTRRETADDTSAEPPATTRKTASVDMTFE